MRRLAAGLLAAVLMVPLASCAHASELTTTPMSKRDLARLPVPDVVGAGEIGEFDAPAVLYGVWDPARGVALRAFGLADRAARTPATPDQTFRIASITKTFTATAVLLLVDDGRVELDAPVARYVGAKLLAGLPNGTHATVRSLLNMTSGFPDYVGRGGGPFAQAVASPQRIWRARRLVRAAARNPAPRPGSFSYSNTNYAILGVLVAKRSGMPFAAFVKRRILDPLGLDHTRIPSPVVTAPVQLHGYLDASWDGGRPLRPRSIRMAGSTGEDVTGISTSSAAAAANGVSTLADLARWAQADFGDALLQPGTRAARLRAVPAGSLLRGSSYGLGLQMEDGWHFHVGELFGWETLAMANPSSGQVVVVARNACCGSVFETYLTARAAMPALAPIVDPVYRP